LRMEREILKKTLRIFSNHRNEIPHHRGSARDVPIRVLCDVMASLRGVLCLARSPESPRKTANRALLTRSGPSFGPSRPLWRAENPRGLRDLGHTASRGRIERLMRHHDIRAITARRFRTCTTDSRHDWPSLPTGSIRTSLPIAQSSLACRHNLCANLGRLALSGCRARSFHQEDCWMGDA